VEDRFPPPNPPPPSKVGEMEGKPELTDPKAAEVSSSAVEGKKKGGMGVAVSFPIMKQKKEKKKKLTCSRKVFRCPMTHRRGGSEICCTSKDATEG